MQPGDPFTPLLRVEEGDVVRLKIQAGGYEHERNGTVHGMKWLQAGGSFGEGAVRSGWRNAQNLGISEQTTLGAPIGFRKDGVFNPIDLNTCIEETGKDLRFGGTIVKGPEGRCPERTDYAYTVDASQDGWWTGVWGLIRTYQYRPKDLAGATLQTVDRDRSVTLAERLAPRRLVTIDPARVHPGFLRDPIVRTIVRMGREGIVKTPVPLEKDLKAVRKGLRRPLPLVLRARAGECMKVVLHNDLPKRVPDLAGYTTLLQVVRREATGADGGMTTFQNNLIRPSNRVGLHPQMVYYNMRNGDGTNVGLNPEQTTPVGGVREIFWYAGDIRQVPNGAGGYAFLATPVESGVDHGSFREFVTVVQKTLGLRYRDATAVENIASEAPDTAACGPNCPRAPEDSHDAGQMAFNYRTEPMWFRYGVRADTDFLRGEPGNSDLATLPDLYKAYSNTLVGGDPETPVFQTAPGQPFRMRLVVPTGVGRATNFGLHGHVWERYPHLELTLPSQVVGDNRFSRHQGSQESLTPAAHFEIRFPCAGGTFRTKGDYLFRDNASFGNLNGLWGIVRVEGEPQSCP